MQNQRQRTSRWNRSGNVYTIITLRSVYCIIKINCSPNYPSYYIQYYNESVFLQTKHILISRAELYCRINDDDGVITFYLSFSGTFTSHKR
jgi:hypothetical protein